MSNFSFSHSVFKRLASQGRQKVSFCGNGISYKREITSSFRSDLSVRGCLPTSLLPKSPLPTFPQFIPIPSLCRFAPFFFRPLPICPIPTSHLTCVTPFSSCPLPIWPLSDLPLPISPLSCFATSPLCPFPNSPLSCFAPSA